MDSRQLFNTLKNELEARISFLKDKPEETIDSTLSACWLAASGVPQSAEEAINHVLPKLTEDQIDLLYRLIDLRLQNTPLAHITGRQSFMGIQMLSDKRALIPRKETEILGFKSLEICNLLSEKKENVRVMDICCGAGNLALAVACNNYNTTVFASDLSQEAVDLAKENISFLDADSRVEAIQSDLFSAFEKEEFYGTIDLIICNPPYISSTKVAKMPAQISDHEPVLAFDGGMFGTRIIQNFLREAPKFLSPAGFIAIEVGAGQGEFIMRLCSDTNCYTGIESVADEMGNIRVISARKKTPHQI